MVRDSSAPSTRLGARPGPKLPTPMGSKARGKPCGPVPTALSRTLWGGGQDFVSSRRSSHRALGEERGGPSCGDGRTGEEVGAVEERGGRAPAVLPGVRLPKAMPVHPDRRRNEGGGAGGTVGGRGSIRRNPVDSPEFNAHLKCVS